MRNILLVLPVLALASNANGQGMLEGVSFSVDVLNLTTAGADVDQVQVFTIRQTAEERGTLAQRTITVDYGTSFRRIDMNIAKDRALSWSAGYRRGDWGVDFRRWSTEGDASFRELITSSPERASSSIVSASLSQTIQGCRVWDNTQVPVLNTRDAAGFSPVDCYARNALRTSKMDIMLERAWIDSPRFQTVVKIGAAIGHMEHHREEGQEQNAFIEFPPQNPFGMPFDRLTNRITLDSTGDATGRFLGPNIELAGSFGFSRLQADWRVNQSVLIGDVELTSEWIDIDRVSVTGRFGGVAFTESQLLEGRYPLSEKRRAAMPVLDSHIKMAYRVTDTINAGVGFFISSWQSVPLASSWSVPGEWTDAAGTHWKRNQSNLVFHGLSLFGRVAF
ncbi:MAG TPA: hypothetical protein VIK60_15550 [Vicinamibacterales bacterium]